MPKSVGAKFDFVHVWSAEHTTVVALGRQGHDFLLVFYSVFRSRWNRCRVMILYCHQNSITLCVCVCVCLSVCLCLSVWPLVSICPVPASRINSGLGHIHRWSEHAQRNDFSGAQFFSWNSNAVTTTRCRWDRINRLLSTSSLTHCFSTTA